MEQLRLTHYQLNQLAEMVAEKMLAKLDARRVTLPSENKMTAKEAAEYLKVSISTLRHLQIPHTKVGRQSLYTESTLYNYLHR